MKRKPVPVELWNNSEQHKFESISECARFLRITPGEVSQCKHTCRGWNIKFLGVRTKLSQLKVPVYQFDTNGKYLQTFESVHEAARFAGMTASNFILVLKNKGRGFGKGLYGEYMYRHTKENGDTHDPADYA